MEIEYKGDNCITLKQGNNLVVVDPVETSKVKFEGSITVVTNETTELNQENKLFIHGPGEYEVAGISIKGVASAAIINPFEQMNTMYSIDIAGYRVGIIGKLTEKLTDDKLEALGIIDILILPIGENQHLDLHGLVNVVKQISPKMVIPTDHNQQLTVFLKELGATQHETTEKLKLKQGTHLPELLTVVELKKS